MVKCHNCGAELKDNSKYCYNCGSNLSDSAFICPFCHKSLEKKSKFCPSCGKSLDGGFNKFLDSKDKIINKTESLVKKEPIKKNNQINKISKNNDLVKYKNKPIKNSHTTKGSFCPKCARKIDYDDRFCDNCGYDFKYDKPRKELKSIKNQKTEKKSISPWKACCYGWIFISLFAVVFSLVMGAFM